MHAHTQPINADTAQIAQVRAINLTTGVGLAGNLRLIERHQRTRRREDLFKLGHTQQRRRATAKKDRRAQRTGSGRNRQRRAERGKLAQFVTERSNIGRNAVLHVGVGVKIAVRAAPGAEWNMDIQVFHPSIVPQPQEPAWTSKN